MWWVCRLDEIIRLLPDDGQSVRDRVIIRRGFSGLASPWRCPNFELQQLIHRTPHGQAMTGSNGERVVANSREFSTYQEALARWLSRDVDDDSALTTASMALCELARERGVLPEQLVVEVRNGGRPPITSEGTDRVARQSQERAHRYTLAVGALLTCYFS